jgi:hypothetical protein
MRRQDQVLAPAVLTPLSTTGRARRSAALFRRTDAFHGASVLLHGQPQPLDCDVQPYIRATCNPDADSWVADFLVWWIDPETGLPIPERVGVLRDYVRVAEKIVWADRPEDLMQYLPRPEDLPPDVNLPRPISVTFIPATVFDNPALLQVNPKYFAWLCHCRSSSASGYWAEIGRSGRPPGPISSGSGVSSSTKFQRTSTSSAIGISPPPKRPSSTTPIGLSASSSAAIRTAVIGCSIWCPGGPTRATSTGCCSIPGRQDGKRVRVGFGKDPGQAGKSQALHLVRALSGFTVGPAAECGYKRTRFGPFSSQCRVGSVKIPRAPGTRSCSASSKASPISLITSRSMPAAEPWKFLIRK